MSGLLQLGAAILILGWKHARFSDSVCQKETEGIYLTLLSCNQLCIYGSGQHTGRTPDKSHHNRCDPHLWTTLRLNEKSSHFCLHCIHDCFWFFCDPLLMIFLVFPEIYMSIWAREIRWHLLALHPRCFFFQFARDVLRNILRRFCESVCESKATFVIEEDYNYK